MKKFTILFLAALFMVAGTAYLISMTSSDRAEHTALAETILSLRKAMLGSTGLEVTQDRIARSRGEGRIRTINGLAEAYGAGGCGMDSFTATIDPDSNQEFCLACMAGQIVKLDVLSERLGAPTDVALEVLDAAGGLLYARDDGRGLGGASTDACLIFECPADGQYNVRLSNLATTAATADQSVFTLVTSVLCDLEVEPNDPGTPGDLNCLGGGGVVDEDEDADMREHKADEDEDGDMYSYIQGTYGGSSADVDCWTVCLAPGEVFMVGMDSGECDDLTDADQVNPVLELTDANGDVVASDLGTDLDAALSYRAPDMGNEMDTYVLCLSDDRLTNPGVYDLYWTIVPQTITDDINCATGGVVDEDEDEDSDL